MQAPPGPSATSASPRPSKSAPTLSFRPGWSVSPISPVADRYGTNANVANWGKANGGLAFTHTGLATGDKFPDALSSGPYLARDHGILLLSPLLGPLPPGIGALIDANRPGIADFSFIAMIEPVVGQVKALLP